MEETLGPLKTASSLPSSGNSPQLCRAGFGLLPSSALRPLGANSLPLAPGSWLWLLAPGPGSLAPGSWPWLLGPCRVASTGRCWVGCGRVTMLVAPCRCTMLLRHLLNRNLGYQV